MANKFTLILLLLFLTGPVALATHIVGGDFYYEYVDTNSYRITLKLYVDCENGNLGAIASDKIAIIGIFNAKDNSFQRTFTMQRKDSTRLNKVLYDCVVPEKDVCVDGYSYSQIVSIDPGSDGVILAFQRCCRNKTITNIISPQSTGATYWMKITGKTTALINSSPVYNELPPNYICTDAPLQFDHSATDKDGDSLAYELYQPYSGASPPAPRPPKPSTPPFQPIIWRLGYTTNNQMLGNPILKIDRITGKLTVTPNAVGQFVIGVKVKEYRNGVQIGETLRDYQFNVRKCKFDIIANFTTPQAGEPMPLYYCNDSVFFFNRSFNADKYFWDFGDPSTDKDTSSDVSPSWVYPGDGDYTATLRASNHSCVDSIHIKVKIREKVKVDLGPDKIVCDLFTTNILVNDIEATSVKWNTGDTGKALQVTDTGLYIAKVYYGQCFGTDSVRVLSKSVNFSMPNDSSFCDPIDYILDAQTEGPTIKYNWSTGINDTLKTKRVFAEGLYWVRVSNKHCEHVDTILLSKLELPTSNLSAQRPICNEDSIFLDVGVEGYNYYWEPTNANSAKVLVSKEGKYKVKIVADNECFIWDSTDVQSYPNLYDFFIPNVFTPNHDRYNEHYFIDFTGYKIVYFNIYNRWGEKMYQAEGTTVDWDGKTASKLATEGVYFVVAKIEDNCGETRLVHGTITLIR
jgi:gliding motility-associated-like protein